jgi:hypothetical protein
LDIWLSFLEASWLAVIAILIPIFWLRFRKMVRNQSIAIDRNIKLKLVIMSIVFSFIIFSFLVFLTGGINNYYYLQEGLFIDEKALDWNISRHLKITIQFNPGMNFLAVSILSGFVYSGLLISRQYCKIDLQEESSHEDETNTLKTTATTSVSSIIAGSSALASGVICCSTSIVAVISPAVATILSPISPLLITLSLIMLNFSLIKYVIPRFPTESTKEEDLLINFDDVD